MFKLSKEMKKLMDREFRQYKDNKCLLNRIKQENKIPSRAVLICEDRMKYIENIYKRLTPFEKQVFEYIFYKNYDWAYCESNFNISKSTYYNIYNKCINFLAAEWGEV